MTEPLILISDDDPIILHALSRSAERLGIPAIVDFDGKVVELARRRRPAVILLDLHQQGLDGRDALARLRSDPLTRDSEVIVMSGLADSRTRVECLVLGATSFEPKPFRSGLMDDVAALVRLSTRRANAATASAWASYPDGDRDEEPTVNLRPPRPDTGERRTSTGEKLRKLPPPP